MVFWYWPSGFRGLLVLAFCSLVAFFCTGLLVLVVFCTSLLICKNCFEITFELGGLYCSYFVIAVVVVVVQLISSENMFIFRQSNHSINMIHIILQSFPLINYSAYFFLWRCEVTSTRCTAIVIKVVSLLK